jgi:prepilin-type N-terminal cleavage/methylation domain-containing protein
MKHSGFSLIELLLATVLSAVLMAGVLVILSGVARDRVRLNAAENVPSPDPIIARFQWDLANAQTMSQSPDGRSLSLTGHGGIDPVTLAPNGRLASVSYRLYRDETMNHLVREQHYLDDPAAPRPWRELIATGVTGFHVVALSPGEQVSELDQPRDPSKPVRPGEITPGVYRVPARIGLQIVQLTGVVDRELWVR